MSTYTMETEKQMKASADRLRALEWQGEVATPRVFIKQGEYTAAELRSRWRHTIWDTVPSVMSGQRVPRRVPV